MQKIYVLILLAGAAVLGGCDKQTQVNTEKIQALSQKIIQLQQNQARELEALQSQLASLPPMLDKMDSYYYAKGHNDALFYHTNSLQLLLAVDRKISTQFQDASTERETANSLAYYYHTNQTDTMFFCAAQIEDAMAGQEKRIEDTVNTETRRVGAGVANELQQQIKLSAPDKAEVARRMEMEVEIGQIKRDIELIKTRLGITNPPPASNQ
jgi:Tfp pilus assembly protein PilV